MHHAAKTSRVTKGECCRECIFLRFTGIAGLEVTAPIEHYTTNKKCIKYQENRRTMSNFLLLKYVFSPPFPPSLLSQPCRLWFYIGDPHAQAGSRRTKPAGRLHGSEGLDCADRILQILGEGLGLLLTADQPLTPDLFTRRGPHSHHSCCFVVVSVRKFSENRLFLPNLASFFACPYGFYYVLAPN